MTQRQMIQPSRYALWVLQEEFWIRHNTAYEMQLETLKVDRYEIFIRRFTTGRL